MTEEEFLDIKIENLNLKIKGEDKKTVISKIYESDHEFLKDYAWTHHTSLQILTEHAINNLIDELQNGNSSQNVVTTTEED